MWLKRAAITLKPDYFSFYCLDNYIDGREFTKLTDAEVKQMIQPIGIAKIVRLIPVVNYFHV